MGFRVSVHQLHSEASRILKVYNGMDKFGLLLTNLGDVEQVLLDSRAIMPGMKRLVLCAAVHLLR